ncbi:helix-turn-helix transcriptional regulator [Alkalimarinus coralli]|uniref:helix-turn-helix transcriptional regulator n=1 Tax=Alkalimarinus coralli TaxID=2935863 RepID=UPI00202B0F87|nr:WYL domain-containing protein [Alkalimarinus coralli]
MPQSSLEELSQSQKERLFHIDFKLRFLGLINRNDLVTRFGIKQAAATRDIALYKELAPNNLTYDTKAKTYFQADKYKPLFECSGTQALCALSQGLGDDSVSQPSSLIETDIPSALNTPNLDVLAEITKAIFQEKALKIEYRSLSSGLTKREIVPFALVDNGLRWHIRAFDRKSESFRDFVLNRVSKPKRLSDDIPKEQTREADIQWNRIVEMHLVPHPNLKHPKTIETEYAMTGGVLNIQVRAAVAGYVLRKWNVDCTEDHSLNSPETHLWLKNTQTLYGVSNLEIAPGYQKN